MKPKAILLALTALTVAAIAVLFLFATPQSSVKTFRVRGEIRGIALAEKTIRIAHEEIPGYMPAMTMPLNIKSPSLFQGLSLGDHIRFELTVTDKSSWISAIEKLPMPTNLEAPAEPPIASGMDREADRVKTGQAVPDFALLNQNGDRIQLSDYRGKYVLVTFIYTRCPIPDFCPLMSKKFQ